MVPRVSCRIRKGSLVLIPMGPMTHWPQQHPTSLQANAASTGPNRISGIARPKGQHGSCLGRTVGPIINSKLIVV